MIILKCEAYPTERRRSVMKCYSRGFRLAWGPSKAGKQSWMACSHDGIHGQDWAGYSNNRRTCCFPIFFLAGLVWKYVALPSGDSSFFWKQAPFHPLVDRQFPYVRPSLVGGFNPSEKHESVGAIIPNIWNKKTCSKSPTSIYRFHVFQTHPNTAFPGTSANFPCEALVCTFSNARWSRAAFRTDLEPPRLRCLQIWMPWWCQLPESHMSQLAK